MVVAVDGDGGVSEAGAIRAGVKFVINNGIVHKPLLQVCPVEQSKSVVQVVGAAVRST